MKNMVCITDTTAIELQYAIKEFGELVGWHPSGIVSNGRSIRKVIQDSYSSYQKHKLIHRDNLEKAIKVLSLYMVSTGKDFTKNLNELKNMRLKDE